MDDESDYRNSQLVKMQKKKKSTDHKVPNSNWNISNTTIRPNVQETWHKRGKEYCKGKRTQKSSAKLCLLSIEMKAIPKKSKQYTKLQQ